MSHALKIFSLSALFVVALSALVVGGALEDELKFYLNSGETQSIMPVSVDGATYSVIKVNNVESFVFDSSPALVRDGASIKKVIDKYVATQYDQLPPINVDGIKAAYLDLNSTVGGVCMTGVNRFQLYTGPGTAYFLIYIQQSIRPKQWAATVALNTSASAVRMGLNTTRDSVADLQDATAAKDINRVYTDIANAHDAAIGIQSNFSSLSAAYKDIVEGTTTGEAGYVYAFGGPQYNCNVSSNVTSALTNFISLTNLQKPDSLDAAKLQTTITTRTTARYEPALVKKVFDKRSAQYIEVRNTKDKVSTGFSALGLTLSFIASSDVVLASKLAAIANSTTVTAAEAAAVTFDTELAKFKTQIGDYSNLLTDYSAAKGAVSNASTQLASASAKYGLTDSRVQGLTTQQANMTARMTLLEGELKSGKAVTAQRLKDVKTEADTLAMNAATMRPFEAQLDYVMIGGVVLGIIVIIGIIWFARKKKRENEGL